MNGWLFSSPPGACTIGASWVTVYAPVVALSVIAITLVVPWNTSIPVPLATYEKPVGAPAVDSAQVNAPSPPEPESVPKVLAVSGLTSPTPKGLPPASASSSSRTVAFSPVNGVASPIAMVRVAVEGSPSPSVIV